MFYFGWISVIYIGLLSFGCYDFFGEFLFNMVWGMVVVMEVDNVDN